MSMNTDVWTLTIDGRDCGQLTLKYVDQPWFYCAFQPTPNFDAYAATFHEEEALLNGASEREWKEFFDQIPRWDVRLIDQNGVEIEEVLLHVDRDNEASFRY